ncbi:hypothetical protein BDQ17DRAFT_139617 [Cyathus striatus]|nr:hypothetical protein BDQ17DRAFT_139617 [Cyathus striatus]
MVLIVSISSSPLYDVLSRRSSYYPCTKMPATAQFFGHPLLILCCIVILHFAYKIFLRLRLSFIDCSSLWIIGERRTSVVTARPWSSACLHVGMILFTVMLTVTLLFGYMLS